MDRVVAVQARARHEARAGRRHGLAVAADHLKGVGAGLDRAVRKYNDFVGSFERNVLTSGRRLRDKGIAIGKREIEDVPEVEAMPRHGDPEPRPALTLVEPDAAGRLLLPKTMLEHAKLSKDLIFSAQMDKVELWDADAFRAQTAMSSDDLSQLANDVLGSDFLNAQDGI